MDDLFTEGEFNQMALKIFNNHPIRLRSNILLRVEICQDLIDRNVGTAREEGEFTEKLQRAYSVEKLD
jgi:hypothetical protein